MLKCIFYCILFVLCGHNTFAQETEKVSYVLDNEELPDTYLEFRELEAKKYIDLLKDGALLVKINSEQRKIEL